MDNNILKEREEILKRIRNIQTEQGKDAAKLDTEYIKLKGRLAEIVEILKETVKKQRESVDGIIKMNDEVSSLSSVYRNIKKETSIQKDLQISVADSIGTQLNRVGEISEKNKNQANIVNDILSSYQQQTSLATQLAQLSEEDAIERGRILGYMAAIQNSIEEQVNSLDMRTKIAKDFVSVQSEIEDSIKNQVDEAIKLSSLTSEQKQILENQASAFKTIEDKINALGSTLTTYLQRPQALIGGLVIGAGVLVDKFADVNKQLGNGFDILNSTTISAGLLGFIFEDSVSTVTALANEFGGVEAATFKTQASVGLIASNMGISNTEAVSLMGSFATLNDGSTDIAADMIKTTQEFAKQNGVIPADLMKDLASNTEAFALYGKDGGKNLIQAAAAAKKMGVELKTMTTITDTLLDFESSITKELELGAMLGKNINLDRARALAFEGKTEEAVSETLKSLGGIEQFNKMDVFSKRATADLLGISVDELSKMVSNQEKAATKGAIIQKEFSMIGETINAGLNNYLGTSLKGLGGMITMAGDLGLGFKSLGIDMGGIVKSTGQVLKNILGMVAGPVLGGLKTVGSSLANTGVGKAIGGFKDKLFKGVGDKATESISDKMTDSVGGDKKSKGVGGFMKGMGAGIKSLASIPVVAIGKLALIMGTLTLAIIGIGYALKLAAPGIEAFGTAISNIVSAVGGVIIGLVGALGDMFTKISSVASPELALSILGLAGGFYALTASLAAFSVAGIAAIPSMLAVSAFAAVGGESLLGIGETESGGGDETMKMLLEEIKGLRTDLNSGKIAVYMDGSNVTSKISKVVDRIGINSYS